MVCQQLRIYHYKVASMLKKKACPRRDLNPRHVILAVLGIKSAMLTGTRFVSRGVEGGRERKWRREENQAVLKNRIAQI